MKTLAQWRSRQSALPDPETAALDIDLLLCHVLQKPRYFLHAYPETLLSADEAEQMERLLARRIAGEPMAYLTGSAEFWSLALATDPSTLVPRPDTELLVEWLLERNGTDTVRVLDLGTGTGAIALALASERPQWQVEAVDRSIDAVALAQRNAVALGLERVRIYCSDWFSKVTGRFDIVVSNPPYIEEGDHHLRRAGVVYEPASALVSGVDGLHAIRLIANQAPDYLACGGLLLLEHGYCQADAVATILADAGFADIETRRDLGGNPRATIGVYPR